MARAITRRDFLNGVALGAGGALVKPRQQGAANPEDRCEKRKSP